MIAHENAALQKRSLEITERLFKSGNDSELDVQQARAQYLGTLATIPQLEASLRQTQNALSTLLARPPGPLPEMAAGKDVIPQAELDVIVDMPADLLRRRPDVRAAEMQLAAQSALIGVSAADLYPSISLLGSVGLSATSLGSVDAGADLGRRAQPRLERVRPRPAHQHGAGAGRALPAALRAVPGHGAARGARGRRRRRRLCQDRRADRAARRSREGRAALARHRHAPVPRRADRLPARARLAARALQPAGAVWSAAAAA